MYSVICKKDFFKKIEFTFDEKIKKMLQCNDTL